MLMQIHLIAFTSSRRAGSPVTHLSLFVRNHESNACDHLVVMLSIVLRTPAAVASALQLVIVVINTWHNLLDTLPLSHGLDNLTRLSLGVERRATGQNLPMVED